MSMGKIDFKPGNMLYPLPAVLVTVRTPGGEDNIITVAWTGTVCTNPPMLYISVRPERYSYQALKETGEFVINLTTGPMACRVKEVLPLGSHHMFLAEVVHVTVDERYMDEKGTFHLEGSDPIVYSHGTYFNLGNAIGTFGYSVRKKKKRKKKT